MPQNVLNIAAGFMPIVASDFAAFEVGRVVNYDPLGQVGVPLLKTFSQIVGSFPDIEYTVFRTDVDRDYANATVDLVLAISPFGFSLIDAWTDAKLKVGGYVVIVSAAANKWAKDANLFSPVDLKDKYQPVDAPAPWVQGIATKVAQSYPSHTSHLEHGTVLEKTRILLKIA